MKKDTNDTLYNNFWKGDRIYVVKRTLTKKDNFALNEFALIEHRTKREVAVIDQKVYILDFHTALCAAKPSI